MVENSTRLTSEKMGEVGKKTTNKSKHTKNNQFGQEVLDKIDTHVFRNESLLGTCDVGYAVLQVARLELVVAQMIGNLSDKILNSLPNYNTIKIDLWSDNTAVFYWLQDSGNYKLFS